MATDDWCTCPDVEEGLYKFHRGPVGLDPCSNERSIIRARRRYTAGALHLPWDAPTIFKNPPYSQLLPWTEYGIEQLQRTYRGRGKTMIDLVPATPSTEWWLKMLTAEPLLIFTKRLPFINEQGVIDSGARFDCVLALYHGAGWRDRGAVAESRARFLAVFRGLTRWVVQVDSDMADDARETLARVREERVLARRKRKAA